jgi:hypothetical protein
MIWGKKQTASAAASVAEFVYCDSLQTTATAQPAIQDPSYAGKKVRGATLDDLPTLLLNQDLVTREQMQMALQKHRLTGAYIGDILLDEGFVEESEFVAFLVKNYKLPHLCIRGYSLDEALLALVPRDVCLQYNVVPIDRMGQDLTLAMVNPFDTEALDTIHKRCASFHIRPILCSRCHFKSLAAEVLDRRNRAVEVFGALRRRTDTDACGAAVISTESSRTNGENQPTPGFTTPEDRDAPVNTVPFSATFTLQSAPPKAANDKSASRPSTMENGLARWPNNAQDSFSRPFSGDVGAFEILDPKTSTPAADGMGETLNRLLRRVTLFRGVTPESVAQLLSRARIVKCGAGELILRRGEANSCVYVVLSGAVESFDASRKLEDVRPGETFGETALVNSPLSVTSVRATEPSCLMQFTTADVTQNLPTETVVRLMINITVTLGRRLRTAQAALSR